MDGLRGASELDVELKRNDPYRLTQKHQGIESRRVPDVVIVPRGGAKTASEQASEQSKSNARARSETSLTWQDILSVLEFKKNKNTLKPPAQSYTVGDYIEPKPVYLGQGYMESPEGKTEEGAVDDEGMVVSGVRNSGSAAAGESRVDRQGRGERESETSK